MIVLTKSKFKLGLECASKLFFAQDKNYVNKKIEDTFLQALAEGGFQVEEYARLHFPNGIFISAPHGEYAEAHHQTMNYLQRHENITLFEAGFLVDGLFIRADIVVKKGNHIQLIEVKAKSYDLDNEDKTILTKKGLLRSEWKPYLFDLAFQTHVIRTCLPQMMVDASLMLADKNKIAPVHGLNQNFRYTLSKKVNRNIQVIDNTPVEWKDSVMLLMPQTQLVDDIIAGNIEYRPNQFFASSIVQLKQILLEKEFPAAPLKQSICKKCEFRKKDIHEEGLSGMAKCFAHHRQLNESALYEPNLLDVWDNRNEKLFEAGHFSLTDLKEDQWKIEDEDYQFSRTRRQWIQIESAQNGNVDAVVEKDGLKQKMSEWQFPLHFIDFETSRVALPFFAGSTPYEQVAFQFSHHVMDESGRVTHAHQEIIADGQFPNFTFIRKLKESLSQDNGTVFTYSHHEKTVIKEIRYQLEKSQEADASDLIAFIDALSEERFVDLLKMVKKYYYHPYMGGSNSLKYVLPAILKSSPYLQSKYSKPIGEIGLSSLNFSEQHIWINADQDNPYKTLPPIYAEMPAIMQLEEEPQMSDIQDGGAAMMAYALLMYTDISAHQRQSIQAALLRYCELDTLAMVMLYEVLKEVA